MYNRNISKLMTFIFRNRTIFWDVSKWNRRQKKMGRREYIYIYIFPRAAAKNWAKMLLPKSPQAGTN